MANAKDKIEAELENIERILADIPNPDTLNKLSALELAGAGALLHNFYNGVENVLKQASLAKGIAVEQGPSWHSGLIETSVANQIISRTVGTQLRKYLAFRHFFSHGYCFDLDAKRMMPLLRNIKETYRTFVQEIEKTLKE